MIKTSYPELFAALAMAFDPQEVKVRSQAGRQLSYITARTAMNRLDEVLGPENWWDRYSARENSVVCELTIRLPDPDAAEGRGWRELTKSDAGGYAGMADAGDDDKSGYSDAFKRAAVKFGVGRYLYRDGVPSYGEGDDAEPAHRPEPASQARPPYSEQQRHHGEAERPAARPGGGGNGPAPRTGRALFAWTKEQEQKHEVGLLKYLNSWSKLQDFPGRMVDWDADQVSQGYAEAVRKLQSLTDREMVQEEAISS